METMKIVKASLLTVLALGPVTNIDMAGEIESWRGPAGL
jgi:hypothetical protein